MRTVAFVVMFGGAVAASQGQPAPAQATGAFELAQAAVKAFSLAASIEESVERIDRNRLTDQSGRFEATNLARRALGQSQDASSLFGRPIGPANSPVRKAAGAMRAPFNQLSSSLGDAIRVWEKIDRANDENESADLVRSSTALLTNEGPWERLGQATVGVTDALLDMSRATAPGDKTTVRHLLLTKAERETVLTALKQAFPRLATNARGGRVAESAAGILFEFLSQPLAGSDEP